MLSESILQRRISLAELLDVDSFRDVMRSLADLYLVGIKVFDAEGTKLVDVRVGAGPFCAYLFQHGKTRVACTELVGRLKRIPVENLGDGVHFINCFSGLRYALIPIVYEGDYLGRVIFGPFLPKELPRPSPALFEMEPGLDEVRLQDLISPVRIASEEGVRKMLGQLKLVVDVLIYTSYRAVLTSQMHIESVTASYHELMDKNRQLEERNERLKELDRLKSNFLAVVSHELRTPLTSVIGYAEMLAEGMAGQLNDEQREYVTTIMEKGDNLLQLISSLLDLSRIEAGKVQLSRDTIDLAEIISAALSSVTPQITKKQIRYEQHVAEGLPTLIADRDKVRQILTNLLSNASKFTLPKGLVRLEVSRYFGPRRSAAESASAAGSVFSVADEEFIQIRVTDSGIGIAEDKLERIFESFFQVDSSSTREYGGTGLGLSIIKSFVEAHGGEVFAESRPGEGSAFTVRLPTRQP